MSGKTLVAYFFASGVTEAVARRLADAIGADYSRSRPGRRIPPPTSIGPTPQAGALASARTLRAGLP